MPRTLFALHEVIVLGVRANPEPNDFAIPLDSERTKVQANSS